jgi:hypothetical protein
MHFNFGATIRTVWSEPKPRNSMVPFNTNAAKTRNKNQKGQHALRTTLNIEH